MTPAMQSRHHNVFVLFFFPQRYLVNLSTEMTPLRSMEKGKNTDGKWFELI